VLLPDGSVGYTSNNAFFLLDEKSGAVTWESPLTLLQRNTMRSNGSWIAEISDPQGRSRIAVVTGVLVLLDSANRKVHWKATLDPTKSYHIDSIGDKHVYLIERDFGRAAPYTRLCAYSIDKGGELAWRFRLLDTRQASVTTIIGLRTGLVQATSLSFSRHRGAFILFDIHTGKRLQRISFENRQSYIPSFTLTAGILAYIRNNGIEGWGK
jgi:outer membrane protein assembly factor BamB